MNRFFQLWLKWKIGATEQDSFNIRYTIINPEYERLTQLKLALKVYECTWTFMGFHGKKRGSPLHRWLKNWPLTVDGAHVVKTQHFFLVDIHEGSWTKYSILSCTFISLKFMDRLVYEKCCALTTWKFIDFHVNQSLATNDSVLGKRVLMYWKNRGHTDYIYINAFTVPTESYIFLERWGLSLSKNI